MGGWGGVGGVGGYDQLCCPASPKLLLGLDLGLGCDNTVYDMFHVIVLGLESREDIVVQCCTSRTYFLELSLICIC